MTEHQIQPVKGLIYECEYPERPGLKGTLITAMILPVPRRKEVLVTMNGYFLCVYEIDSKTNLCQLKFITGDPDEFCPVDDLIGPLRVAQLREEDFSSKGVYLSKEFMKLTNINYEKEN